ncbi:hypothetical protein ACF0H5_022835 [Mactra antiquata]
MAVTVHYKHDVNEETQLLDDLSEINNDINKTRKKCSTPTASKCRKLVIMASALVLQCVSIGLGFGMSVMYPELVLVFNELRSKAALIQGIYLGLTCGAGILLTGLIKKVGPGPMIILGSIISCIGFFASGFSQNVSTIIVLAGVVGGFGMSTCYLSAFIAVSWIFHDDPGFPLVCVTVGSSIGQFIIPLLYELFISTYSWAGGFILVSGIALQCLPIGVIIYTSRYYYVTNDVTKEQKVSPNALSTLKVYMLLLKDPLVWILLLDFLLIAATGNVEAWFIVDIMTSRGYPRESGSILVSALGFANFLGRVSGSTVRLKCTRVPTVYHWLWLCPLIAGGHALVINLTDYWALFFACIIQGTTFGMNISQTPAIMFEVSGLDRYPQAMSLVNLMYGFGNVFSNAFGGFVRDTYGQYDIVFYAAVGSTLWIWVNNFCVVWTIRRRKRRENERTNVINIDRQKYEVLK